MQQISEAERIQAPGTTRGHQATGRLPSGHVLTGAALVAAFLGLVFGPPHLRGQVLQPLVLPFTLTILGLYLALVTYLAVCLRREHRDLETVSGLLARVEHRAVLVTLFADTGPDELLEARARIQAALPGARRRSLVTDRLWDLLVALRTADHPGRHCPSARERTAWVQRMALAFVGLAMGAGILGTLLGLIELFDQGTGAARVGGILAAMGGMDQALAVSALAMAAALDAQLLYTCLKHHHLRLHRRLDRLAGAWLLPLVQEGEAPAVPPPVPLPPLPRDEERLAHFLAPQIAESLEPVAQAAERVEQSLVTGLQAQRVLVEALGVQVDALPDVTVLAALIRQSGEELKAAAAALRHSTDALAVGTEQQREANATLTGLLDRTEEVKGLLQLQVAAQTGTSHGLADQLGNMENSSIELVAQQRRYMDDHREDHAGLQSALDSLHGDLVRLHQVIADLTVWLNPELQTEAAP